MEIKKGVNYPKKGMQRDKHPGEVGKDEYTFAMNANTHGYNGDGYVILQNEDSNIKCSAFKDGFKVIGHKFDINEDRTYFFLTNPTTGCSEIGYIDSIHTPDANQAIEDNCSCNVSVVLESGLENTEQQGYCTYTTLMSDCCEAPLQSSFCLNFDVDYPIHPTNVHIKDERTGKRMYFTDYKNPQRYIQLDNIDYYYSDTEGCDEPVSTCLQCDKMRIFPLFDKPCIEPRTIQTGGNLRAGLYEATLAYCDSSGNEVSNYYSTTNPIPIFDENKIYLVDSNLDYITNFSIGLRIGDLDKSYDYYKIVVIHRSGQDQSVRYKVLGIYPTSTERITLASIENKEDANPQEIKHRKPFYKRAKGMAAGNGYLFQFGLEAQREINLQPVVNLMGGFVKWNTVMAKEGLYKDGVNSSKYAHFMRDEVYPLSIKFFKTGGQELPNFTFIPRPPTADELTEYVDINGNVVGSNTNVESIVEFYPDCSESNRRFKWQFENTATVDEGLCPSDVGTIETTVEKFSSCQVRDAGGGLVVVDSIVGPETILLDTDLSIVDYISQNTDFIINSTDPQWTDIQNILIEEYPLQTCDPDFPLTCGTPVVDSFEIFPISVGSEVSTETEKPFAEYDRVDKPDNCPSVLSPIPLNEDTAFMTSYMDAGEVVYKRVSMPNSSCGSASLLPTTITPPQSVSLVNKGSIGSDTPLLTGYTSTSLYSEQEVTFTAGTGGTLDVIVNGTTYVATFNTDLATTAADFVTTHAAAILTNHNLTVTSSGSTLLFEGLTVDFSTLTTANPSTDMAAAVSPQTGVNFRYNVHTNAVWYKVDFGTRDKVILELSSIQCDTPDDNTGDKIRVTVFDDCGNTAHVVPYTSFITDLNNTNDPNKFITLDIADFTSGNAYIAIDSEITEHIVSGNIVYRLSPPCGCFAVYQRDVEVSQEVTFSDLTFGKSIVYKTECTMFLPDINKVSTCDPVPYQTGKFSYWESVSKYPCNPELWDSSQLNISTSDIPASIQSDFENYYVDSISGTDYVLNTGTDFQDKPIRHYKFPCTNKVPHMSTVDQDPDKFKESVIFPIGFTIDNQVISAFLDIAVKNGLISAEERFSINKYEIFRGDRRYQKSIIAKGILFDMYNYQERNTSNTLSSKEVLYSNYPLNTLGQDSFNERLHPFGNLSNKNFTFHSPDTHFYRPSIPQEMKLDGYLFGHSLINFDIVDNHPRQVVLGDDAYSVATTLAIAEVTFNILLNNSDWSINAFTGDYTTVVGAVAMYVIALAAIVTQAFFKVGELRHQWIETFRNIGELEQFAYYSATIGHYNSFLSNDVMDSMYRAIPVSSYLREGRWNITNVPGAPDIPINNLDRESPVFLSMSDSNYNVNYPTIYRTYDNYDSLPNKASRRGSAAIGKATSEGQTAVPYASLKEYIPDQYGSVNSVEWLSTNYCGVLSEDNSCDPIFGGDTYISRFSVKRKFPFFTTTALGLADRTPFKYSNYFNINPVKESSEVGLTRFYLDYLINDEYSNPLAATVFPTSRSSYNFDNHDGTKVFYEKPPKKFYLYSYGFPHFLVESIYNCNYRYAKEQESEDFYPNNSDVIRMTQETNVSIREPERFFFNTVYLGQGERNVWWTLPDTYSRDLYDKINNLKNSVIYSRVDSSETDIIDPWLIYRPLDFYNFPTNYGQLIDMSSIESEQILARFENGFSIFNSVDNIADRLTPENYDLGQGGIFSGRNVNFNKTDLGYAGTKNVAMVSCNFGHFWADAKRGQVFQLMPNGEGLNDITKGLEKWFKDQLPFKILKAFPDFDVDNNYKDIGLSMGWDERLKRVFITKKDYRVIGDLEYDDSIGFYTGEGAACPTGFEYDNINNICFSETLVNKVPSGTPIQVSEAGDASHGFNGPALYSQYNLNGTANVDGTSPTGYTYQILSDPWWVGNSVIADRYVNKLAKWSNSFLDNVWYGGSSIIDVPTTKTYYLVVAADNQFRISIDGTVIVSSDSSLMDPQHNRTSGTSTFVKAHIYPVDLEAGCRLVKVEGLNEGNAGLFAASILDNTETEIINSTSQSDLNEIYSTENVTELFEDGFTQECPDGTISQGPDLCDLCLKRDEKPANVELIELTDERYFEDCSWTVAYSPILEGWISYYSFLPNYYVTYHDYFQTGANLNGSPELWSHLPHLSSHQVFYGNLYPFTVEYVQGTQGMNSVLQSINYYMETKKFYERFDQADVFGYGFNKAVVYNNSQNSGLIELKHQDNNDLSQSLTYPKHKPNSVEALQSEISGKWSFNHLYNIVRNEKSSLPHWLSDCANIEKTLNNKLLDYRSMYKDRLRGDYFLTRLTQDADSRFKMLFRFAIDERGHYEQ